MASLYLSMTEKLVALEGYEQHLPEEIHLHAGTAQGVRATARHRQLSADRQHGAHGCANCACRGHARRNGGSRRRRGGAARHSGSMKTAELAGAALNACIARPPSGSRSAPTT